MNCLLDLHTLFFSSCFFPFDFAIGGNVEFMDLTIRSIPEILYLCNHDNYKIREF